MAAPQSDSVNLSPPAYPIPQTNDAQHPVYSGQPNNVQYPSYSGQPNNAQYPAYSGQPTHAPIAGPPTNPSAAAAIAGQQYRDQLFAQCALGNHERTTKYGVCGIITAVVFFPIGLICLFTDTHDQCSRCGVALAKR